MTRPEYGVYTVGDYNFFAGVVAAINSLRLHDYNGPIAVLDIGFDPWMVAYLRDYDDVEVLDIEPVRRDVRFTDVVSDESPVMKGWAYKAFGIVHYDRFRSWTFIDGDYLPLRNLEHELWPFLTRGCLVCTEDGSNQWTDVHAEAVGVRPGRYMNINAGFISVSMAHHAHVVHEWRNLMTRRKPFDLWWGDQGALNAILDKYAVEKTCLDSRLWNQTWLNGTMASEGKCRLVENDGRPYVVDDTSGKRVMGWHGVGWHKLWHQIGIDHYRRDPVERDAFYRDCEGRSPHAVRELFRQLLFCDLFNRPLKPNGHLLEVRG
jgi:hypothetical protein